MANDSGLGRRHVLDARDMNHPMRLMLDPLRETYFPRGLPPGTRAYRPGPVLDQGATGTCVGHGWAGWLEGAPLMTKLDAPTSPFALYDACTQIDEFTDNDSDTARQMGTSVRAGAKVLQQLGHIDHYLWAESVEDIRAWHLSGFGTVVLGLNWYSGMFAVDHKGFCRLSGSIQGGHCIKSTGWSDVHGALRIQNSWGPTWGQQGRAWITAADLERLLSEDGEACAAIERKP